MLGNFLTCKEETCDNREVVRQKNDENTMDAECVSNKEFLNEVEAKGQFCTKSETLEISRTPDSTHRTY